MSKQYSFLQLVFAGVLASFITVFIAGGLTSLAADQGRSLDFFQNLPFFNSFFKTPSTEQKTTIPSGVSQEEIPYAPQGEEALVINAVKKVSPAVVSITISKNVPIIEQYFVNPFEGNDLFNQFFGPGFNVQVPQLRQNGFEKKEVGGGTGFVISPNGLILTNKHVVSDTEAEYTVLTNDGKKYQATVLARDPSQDLAVLKINAAGLSAVTLGNSDGLQLGQTAIAIGNALGEFRNTVSLGVVSGLGRSVTATGGGLTENIQGVIQTDAAINPGNSGGPLINLRGEVIGINTAIASGAQNIGFAIPMNKAKRDIKDVISKGKIIVPIFGVRYTPVTADLKEKKSLSYDYGALVASSDKQPSVLPSSPAEKAGIKDGDLILEFAGQKINLKHSLADLVNNQQVGDTVSVKIWRAGQVITLWATLTERQNQ